MKVIESPQNVVDLPSFPSRYGASISLRTEELVTESWSEETWTGSLFEFNPFFERLILEEDTGELRVVPFHKLKRARFTRKRVLPPALVDEPMEGQLEFVDTSNWQFQAMYYLEDQRGLHVLVVQEGDVERYFVPLQSIREYRIGKPLGQILTETTRLEQGDIEEALDIQRGKFLDQPTKKLGEILIEHGKLSETELQKSLSIRLGVPAIDLKSLKPQEDAIALIPEYIARDHFLIPVKKVGDTLVVATLDATATENLNLVSFLTGLTPDPVLATESDLNWALNYFYAPQRFGDQSPTVSDEHVKRELLAEMHGVGGEKPIVGLVNSIFTQAINQGVSDIHFRPGDKTVELLFRIDGNMTFIREFHKSLLPAMVSRIKIMGGMDIATRRIPQDGQLRVIEDGVVIDMRVSVIPTVDGESVVIRLLNTKYGPLTIEQLGFTPSQEKSFKDHLQKSHGFVLVTGPTGSGKSTTLYVALDQVQKRNLSIITLENPVEFHIPGVDQVQINEATGLTFARVLRNVLRHDPEVIMIGEIRDEETASIAVQSSLTGHLVLSTLHTNSAVGAVSRLLDMGVESYLVGPTLLCVIAQRLLRSTCQNCLAEDDIDPVWRQQLQVSQGEFFYRGKGCGQCGGRGFSGRIGVYEFLNISERIASAITEGKDESEIQRLANKEGMSTLAENALSLAREGSISISQVYSILSET